jgi:hypothetical protein
VDDEPVSARRVPLLEPVELGSRETDLLPGIGNDLRPVLRAGERVLFETRSFPTIATLDDDGQVAETFIAGDGGTTTFTDRRMIFVRDVGASDPATVVAVVAGHVRWASVTALSYHHRRRLFWTRDGFYLSTRSASSELLLSATVMPAPNDLCPRVIESISIARRVEIPIPAGRPDGSMNWVF